MSINDRIRRILNGNGWQDQEFASKLGMSKATLSQRFSKNNWTVDELILISELTGYSFSWICEGYGPEMEVDHHNAIEKWEMGDKSDNTKGITHTNTVITIAENERESWISERKRLERIIDVMSDNLEVNKKYIQELEKALEEKEREKAHKKV